MNVGKMVGAAIREFRAIRDYRQRDICALLDVDQSKVSAWENGRRWSRELQRLVDAGVINITITPGNGPDRSKHHVPQRIKRKKRDKCKKRRT